MTTCKDCRHWGGNIKYDTFETCEETYDVYDESADTAPPSARLVLVHIGSSYDGGGEFKTHKDFGCLLFKTKE